MIIIAAKTHRNAGAKMLVATHVVLNIRPLVYHVRIISALRQLFVNPKKWVGIGVRAPPTNLLEDQNLKNQRVLLPLNLHL